MFGRGDPCTRNVLTALCLCKPKKFDYSIAVRRTAPKAVRTLTILAVLGIRKAYHGKRHPEKRAYSG